MKPVVSKRADEKQMSVTVDSERSGMSATPLTRLARPMIKVSVDSDMPGSDSTGGHHCILMTGINPDHHEPVLPPIKLLFKRRAFVTSAKRNLVKEAEELGNSHGEVARMPTAGVGVSYLRYFNCNVIRATFNYCKGYCRADSGLGCISIFIFVGNRHIQTYNELNHFY